MSSVTWTDDANADLMDIVVYVGVHHGRRQAAQGIYDGIKAACKRRSRYAQTGQVYPDLGPNIRAFPFKRWLIVYRARGKGIQVLAIVDSARDLQAFFERRPLPQDSAADAG